VGKVYEEVVMICSI